MAAEEWGDLGPVRVRMALHTEAAEEREGDYFGPPVNRVARLLVMSIAVVAGLRRAALRCWYR